MASSPAPIHAAMWLSPRNSRSMSPRRHDLAERGRRQVEGGLPGEQAAALGAQRLDGAGQQLVGPRDAVGLGPEDPFELGDGAVVAGLADRRGVGLRPPERHGRDDGVGVEHAERRPPRRCREPVRARCRGS